MQRVRRMIAAVLIIAIAAAPLSGCSKSGREYVIFTAAGHDPFYLVDPESGENTGLDMELLSAISKDQGFKYIVRTEKSDRLMSAVSSGQADGALAGIAIKHRLLENYDFSKGYFENGLVFAVRENSETKSLGDLSETVVACITGTPGADYAESRMDEYGYDIAYYNDFDAMAYDLLRGRVSALFESFAAVEWHIKKDGLEIKIAVDMIDPAQCGFVVKKGTNTALLNMFNSGLASIRQSGVYGEILAKYGFEE